MPTILWTKVNLHIQSHPIKASNICFMLSNIITYMYVYTKKTNVTWLIPRNRYHFRFKWLIVNKTYAGTQPSWTSKKISITSCATEIWMNCSFASITISNNKTSIAISISSNSTRFTHYKTITESSFNHEKHHSNVHKSNVHKSYVLDHISHMFSHRINFVYVYTLDLCLVHRPHRRQTPSPSHAEHDNV